MSTTLNAYAIHWTIIKFDHKLTVKAANALRKIGYIAGTNFAMHHYATKDKAENARAAAIELMKKQGRAGSAIIITDKQFGMGEITFTAPATKYDGGFNINVGGGECRYFPATKKQLSEVISF